LAHATQPSRPLAPATLAMAAIGAAALYQFALLFPLAFGLGLPVMFYGNTYLVAAAVLGFVILAWIVQPGTTAAPQPLSRETAPDLYRWLDALCDRMSAPRIHAIALDDELNAGALELHRGVSLRPTKRVLILGMPLLTTLGPKALEAVVAHEIGHFSHQHGRLGHWIYRTRQAWAHHAHDTIDSDMPAWELASVRFAHWFVPWFSAHTFAHARRCEYEADQLAAQAVSAAAVGAALVQVELAALRYAAWSGRGINALQLVRAEPPADWLQTAAAAIAPSVPNADETRRLLSEAEDGDTHPSLAARWRALGLPLEALAQACQPEPECAGAAWLGARWTMLLAERNAAWVTQRQPLWSMRHALTQPLAEHLRSLRNAGTVDTERLRVEWALQNSSDTRSVAASLLKAGQTTAPVRFRLAAAKLAEGTAEGTLDLLRECIAQASGWVVPARALMARHAPELGLDSSAQRENAQLLKRAVRREREARSSLIARVEQGDASPHDLTVTQHRALRNALRQHAAVRQAWCVSASVAIDAKRSYSGTVVIARVDPKALAAVEQTEGDCADLIEHLLSQVIDAGVLAVIRTSFTTEGLPPALEQRLSMLQNSVLV
jgi:Zn-dependent protease with chaperone function